MSTNSNHAILSPDEIDLETEAVRLEVEAEIARVTAILDSKEFTLLKEFACYPEFQAFVSQGPRTAEAEAKGVAYLAKLFGQRLDQQRQKPNPEATQPATNAQSTGMTTNRMAKIIARRNRI